MNKQDALNRLAAIEAETAELKKIIEAPDMPEVFQGRYLNKSTETCFIVYSDGIVSSGHESGTERTAYGSAFATEEAAEKHAKHLRLMQEARVAMAKDWGNVKVDWSNTNQEKYCLDFCKCKTEIETFCITYRPIHFRTESARKEFMRKYSQEDLRLMICGVE